MLPDQCFSSITADQSGLMLHRKLLDGLLGVNNVLTAREFDTELDSIEEKKTEHNNIVLEYSDREQTVVV